MTTLHPTTVALLEAAHAWAPLGPEDDDAATVRFQDAAIAWHKEGSPDRPASKGPDRLSELEARVAALERAQAPTQTPDRTEEEARAKPMRGDRWRHEGVDIHYTVLDSRRIMWSDGLKAELFVGLNDTYLGNFAHELEGP